MRQLPFRFDPGFSFGHLIAAVPSIILAVWFVSGYAHQSDTNQKQLDEMRVNMTAQITTLKSDMTKEVTALRVDMVAQVAQLQLNSDRQFSMVRSDIANIPGMKERVDQLDKRVDQLERRMEPIQQTGIQNAADIANMRESLRQRMVK